MTNSLRTRKQAMNTMREVLEAILRPKKFWEKSTDAETLKVIAERVAHIKQGFWNSVYEQYPELTGKGLTANDYEITIE